MRKQLTQASASQLRQKLFAKYENDEKMSKRQKAMKIAKALNKIEVLDK